MPTLAQEAIREARRVQACQAQSEVMLSHMMIQTPRGWTVRAAHPEYDEPPVNRQDDACYLSATIRMISQRERERIEAAEKRAQQRRYRMMRREV